LERYNNNGNCRRTTQSWQALDVIEHIEDDRAALRSLRQAVRSGGVLVLSVPAFKRLYGPKDRAIGHFRRYDWPTLRRALVATGWSLESHRYWNVIGVVPVFASVVANRRVTERWRTDDASLVTRATRGILAAWFRSVENRIQPPLGLTLLVRAVRRD
jgi:hypothetical protein